MPSANADVPQRFTMLCLKCERSISARTAWIGTEVRCPHCSAVMHVPPPREDGRPVRASPPPLLSREQRFNFACPRCESLLEAQVSTFGQPGRCPTCDARFLIPRIDLRSERPPAAKLIDANDQDPTPMHAYAASGHLAPRIRRLGDGTLHIECPRCGGQSDITANNCSACGVPFTIEGVPTARTGAGASLATAALVLGVLAIPLCMLIVPGLLASGLGVASWLRQPGRRPSGQALAGMILGVIGLAAGFAIHFL